MFRFCLLLALGLLSLTAHPQCTLRLMSYNVKNAVGVDGKGSVQRIADVINSSGADVVALQELDSATVRSNGRYVLGEIARLTQMHPTYAPAIDYNGGKYGIGLLSRQQPLRVSRFALPGREEARVMLVAEFEHFVFCCTHFSLTEQDRMASLSVIRRVAAASTKPFLLAGDFNAEPSSEFFTELQKDFCLLSDSSMCTYPAPSPAKAIDHIAICSSAAGAVDVEAAQVLDEPAASDHRPVLVTLRAEWR